MTGGYLSAFRLLAKIGQGIVLHMGLVVSSPYSLHATPPLPPSTLVLLAQQSYSLVVLFICCPIHQYTLLFLVFWFVPKGEIKSNSNSLRIRVLLQLQSKSGFFSTIFKSRFNHSVHREVSIHNRNQESIGLLCFCWEMNSI